MTSGSAAGRTSSLVPQIKSNSTNVISAISRRRHKDGALVHNAGNRLFSIGIRCVSRRINNTGVHHLNLISVLGDVIQSRQHVGPSRFRRPNHLHRPQPHARCHAHHAGVIVQRHSDGPDDAGHFACRARASHRRSNPDRQNPPPGPRSARQDAGRGGWC